MKKKINIIEVDSRDARYQTGIGRYFDILDEYMPDHIKVLRIVFYRTTDLKEIKIVSTDRELQVWHPAGFPANVLFEAVLSFVGHQLEQMENIIIKSNCFNMEQFVYMIKSRWFCKTISVLHCLPHRSQPNFVFPPINPFYNMDHIILVCDHGKEFLAGVKNKRPYSVIYNGINTPKIQNKKINDGVFRFIFAGGWGDHKGFAKIIPAIRDVAQDHKIEIIIMGGYKDDEDKIFNDIADLPIVKTGLITDPSEIAQFYEMTDCALFASVSEACSFAGCEAMAYNLPIVSTDAAGLVEMFARAALFVKMDEEFNIKTDEYANQMRRIITDKRLRTRLGILAYARYLERYTAKKMARETVAIYESLIK